MRECLINRPMMVSYGWFHPAYKGSTVVNSPAAASPHDLLLWEDGFWCFREEFSELWLRAHDYRVVAHNSEEWLRITV